MHEPSTLIGALSLKALGLSGLHHTPWLVIGLILVAAIVARSMTFILMLFRRKD